MSASDATALVLVVLVVLAGIAAMIWAAIGTMQHVWIGCAIRERTVAGTWQAMGRHELARYHFAQAAEFERRAYRWKRSPPSP